MNSKSHIFEVYDLRTEYLSNPVGVDATNPRLSWKLRSTCQNVKQTTYRIMAYSEGKPLWDSGIVLNHSSRVRYDGPLLNSRQVVTWQVSITAGEMSAESNEVSFEMGLLSESDWKAQWIEPEGDVDPDARKPAPYLRKDFVVNPGLIKARIYQTAHGLYEFWINGKPGTTDKFKPGLTSYYARIQYQVYDITDLLQEGRNIWAVTLGDGWWRGITGGTLSNNFGKKLHFFGQLELYYDDGSVETVFSDEHFRSSTGGLLASDMMMGDVYDARAEPRGWKLECYDDNEWKTVHFADNITDAKLIPSRSVPVRENELFEATPFRDVNGNLVLDFGQNIAGYVHMRLHGCKQGQQIRLTHGETLKNGSFTVEGINHGAMMIEPFQEVTYTASGESVEEYCPDFTVFGFRYVKVEGYDGDIKKGDFTAIAVYSDMPVTGKFVCSDPLINKLVENSLWSQKGNFLEVATDCPTREKNGWTGDNQVYVSTAAYFMDVYAFYEKWLQDMSLEQFESGRLGLTFPSTSSYHDHEEFARQHLLGKLSPAHALAGPSGDGNLFEGSVGWCDAAVRLPYIIYKVYGDIQILRNQYPAAKRWVDYMIATSKNPNLFYADMAQYRNEVNSDAEYLFDTGIHFGEWLEPIEKEQSGDPQQLFTLMMKMGNPLVATAYLRRSTSELAEMAAVLELKEDTQYYRKISEKVANAYSMFYIGKDGVIEPGHQAAYVRALEMDLCSEDQRPEVLKQLVLEIEKNGNRLNTGFLSTPFLLPVLADNGYLELSYRLLEQTENPSWLYSVLHGATTIPESWDGFSDSKEKLSSLNHYAYGSVCEFLFSYVTGLHQGAFGDGYHHFILKPMPGGTLDWAEAEYESPQGTIFSGWKKDGDKIHYTFNIPANTTATVYLSDGQKMELSSGNHLLTATS
jgi:alpha-L-rhamnosidase